jgi:hypothetical protein
MMVIVFTSIKNILFKYKQQGKLLLCHTNLLSQLIYLTYAQKDVFFLFFLY